MFYPKFWGEISTEESRKIGSLPKVLKRNLYQKIHPVDNINHISTKDCLQNIYPKISENKYLEKQIKRDLHQNFSQEKCLAKYLWEEMFTQKMLRHYLPKSFWTYIPKNLGRQILYQKFWEKISTQTIPKETSAKEILFDRDFSFGILW